MNLEREIVRRIFDSDQRFIARLLPMPSRVPIGAGHKNVLRCPGTANRPWSEPIVEGRKEQDANDLTLFRRSTLLRSYAKPSAVLVDDFNACSWSRRAGRNAS
jgi:hypothetical protein